VPASIDADYVLVDNEFRRPTDAVGGPLWRGDWYTLYRLGPDLPGPDRCSQRMVQTVTYVPLT
jgi:hypothetical protein